MPARCDLLSIVDDAAADSPDPPTTLESALQPVESFAPIARSDARCLILGSMPGTRSLARAEYYAHPRNAFWPIMARLFDFPPQLDYAARCYALRQAHVAVWDVLASCHRSGSLDSDIVEATIVTNDFRSFLAGHPALGHVFFNGAKAESSFRRHVLPELGAAASALSFTRLPSTSPAHAALDFAAKLRAWQCVRSAAGDCA